MKRNRFSKTFVYPTLWGFDEEQQMYAAIWTSRPHVSFLSGLPITNPGPENFPHILAKGLNQYPEFRFNPDNVILATYEEHYLIDNGDSDTRAAYCKRVPSADFSALELLKNKLLAEYKEMFGE
jgi:hypothetical protein